MSVENQISPRLHHNEYLPHRYQPVISAGSTGIAPFCVHTYADVLTASAWASVTLLPLRTDAINAAVKLSPAPTVSATSTVGVGWNDTLPGVNT